MYADVATYAYMPIEAGTAARLENEKSLGRRVARNTGSFFEGFISGEGNDTASFVGVVAYDLPVIGDVREIGQEGITLVKGEDYSQFILIGMAQVRTPVNNAHIVCCILLDTKN